MFDVLLNIDNFIEPDIRPSLCISNEERTSPPVPYDNGICTYSNRGNVYKNGIIIIFQPMH